MVAPGGACGCSGGGVRGCSRGACMVAPGGHAWLLPRGGMCGCSQGGHAWLLRGGMHSCYQGGMRGCSGACMVALGGRAWDTTRYGDKVNEWAVRILLECILVYNFKQIPDITGGKELFGTF